MQETGLANNWCVDKEEVIEYKLFDDIYVESFSRLWRRLTQHFEVKKTPGKDNETYVDSRGVRIWDSNLRIFTECYRITRSKSDKWVTITFSNGRVITCTEKHPFETENRGVVFAKDLLDKDVIQGDMSFYFQENLLEMNGDIAWLLGYTMFNGDYTDKIFFSISAGGEEKIEEKIKYTFKKQFDTDMESILQDKAGRDIYKKIIMKGNEEFISDISGFFLSEYEGLLKKDRHIPNKIYSCNKHSRLAFLAGLIDADGFVSEENDRPVVQIGTTNKEKALQIMILVQSCGIPAKVSINNYNKFDREKIRYKVEFNISKEITNYLVNSKKKNNIDISKIKQEGFIDNLINPVKKTFFTKEMYSFDVSTKSHHFTVSGIYSHNCRKIKPEE